VTLELNDSEILRLEKGPMAYLQRQQGHHRNLESFRRAAIEAFGEEGFQVDVKCYDTNVEGVYTFDVEITGRVPGAGRFDPDRQVHEVVNNILEIPDQKEGWIKTDDKMFRDLEQGNVGNGQKHRH
jgi:hypothetical protein